MHRKNEEQINLFFLSLNNIIHRKRKKKLTRRKHALDSVFDLVFSTSILTTVMTEEKETQD
jgi:hypothetical protein